MLIENVVAETTVKWHMTTEPDLVKIPSVVNYLAKTVFYTVAD